MLMDVVLLSDHAGHVQLSGLPSPGRCTSAISRIDLPADRPDFPADILLVSDEQPSDLAWLCPHDGITT